MGNYAEMNEQARMAVEIFARDIRMTSDVLYVGEGEMSLEVSYSQDDVQTVDYIYDSDAGEFIRIVRRIVGKDSKFVILDDLIDLEIKFLNLNEPPRRKRRGIGEGELILYHSVN